MKTHLTKIKKKGLLLITYYLPLLFYKSRLLSSVYYTLFSRAFGREHQAVLHGKIHHIRNIIRDKQNDYLLIRNTHRIEKGLVMRPRKDIFATEYIEETMDSFEAHLGSLCGVPEGQTKWFYDILELYFSVTGSDEMINRQRARFFALKQVRELQDDTQSRELQDDTQSRELKSESETQTVRDSNDGCRSQASGRKRIPYHRHMMDHCGISTGDLYALARQRRSVRWFKDQKVPREKIDLCISIAAQSPSACNRQPFMFHIIDDKELLREVVDLPMGTSGYAHNIPVFVVVTGHLDAYFDERDRHLIYIDASLASMSFMLALETAGLASCPINWPDIEEREKRMQKVLNLTHYQRPVMCIAVGYPDPEGLVASSEKKALDTLRVYNKQLTRSHDEDPN